MFPEIVAFFNIIFRLLMLNLAPRVAISQLFSGALSG